MKSPRSIKCILTLVMVLVMLIAFSGCFSDNPTTQDIINKWQAAETNTNTYAFNMTMAMNASFTGDDPAKNFSMSINADGTGALDNSQKQMKMNLNMDTEIPGKGKVSMPMDYYVMNDTVYMNISIPMVGSQWIKMKLDATQWENQNQMAMQLALLKDAVQVNRVDDEEINGISCYVLEVTPDLAKIIEWFKSFQQNSGAQNLNLDFSQYDLSKLIKQVSLKQWVDKKSYLIVKADVSLAMSINESDFATPTENTGNAKVDMNITESIMFTNYDKPVSIILPPDAENAQEIPMNQN